MRIYNALPKKYSAIKSGEIKIIDGFAYAVRYGVYGCDCDFVFRISTSEYNQIREKALSWELYLAEPNEVNLQFQIWCWLTDVAEMDPYIMATPY